VSRLLPLALLLLPAACGGETQSAAGGPWTGRNMLANPGFEQGRVGWSYRDQSPHWGDFRVVDSPVRSGQGAAQLRLHHGPTLPRRPVKVYGVVQQLTPERVPESVGGYYRVDHWDKSSEAIDLYIQLVAVVWLEAEAGEAPANQQIRYYLAGLDEPPFLLRNARVEFVAKGAPVLGEWQRFEVPLRADFQRLWGGDPQGLSKIDLLFEARWDNMPPRSSVRADVYFDDLFAGEAPGAPPLRRGRV